MDFVKAQFDRIQKQLATLTASQRMLTAALVAIMVMTLLWWGKYAGTAETVPVLDQTLSQDDIARIDMALEAKGIAHSVVGGKVMVPADQKMQLVAELMYEQVLPRDTKSALENMSAQLSPFTPQSDRAIFYNHATEVTLAQILRRFPGVADASVVINNTRERRVEGSIEPTATVVLTMKGTAQANKKLIQAAADGVVGAVAGLRRGNISVIVDGVSHRLHDADAGGAMADSDSLLEMKVRNEQLAENKIRDQFSYIPGLTVSVTCDVENRVTNENSVAYDPTHTLVKPIEEHNHTEETTGPSAGSAEAGVGANTAASIPTGAAPGGGGSSTITDEITKNQILPGQTQRTVSTPAGKATILAAAVRVPRSYFIAIYKQRNPQAKDPDDAALKDITKVELESIRDGVKKCASIEKDDAVSIDSYSDAMPLLAMATTTESSLPLGAVGSHVKEIGLGVLAVVSLMMVSSMVRKSSPAPFAVPVAAAESPTVLAGGESYVGEAGAGQTTLDGMELDEDSVRTQQMLDQVSTMVKENPDGAASMVKRWLNRS